MFMHVLLPLASGDVVVNALCGVAVARFALCALISLFEKPKTDIFRILKKGSMIFHLNIILILQILALPSRF
jgi:hypothetical protein